MDRLLMTQFLCELSAGVCPALFDSWNVCRIPSHDKRILWDEHSWHDCQGRSGSRILCHNCSSRRQTYYLSSISNNELICVFRAPFHFWTIANSWDDRIASWWRPRRTGSDRSLWARHNASTSSPRIPLWFAYLLLTISSYIGVWNSGNPGKVSLSLKFELTRNKECDWNYSWQSINIINWTILVHITLCSSLCSKTNHKTIESHVLS